MPNETEDIQERIAEALENFEPEELDTVTKDRGFRQATLGLVTGQTNMRDWRWHAINSANERLDIPFISQEDEARLMHGAFTAVGTLLDHLLLGEYTNETFRDETLDLFAGKTTVPDWASAVFEEVEQADIPYVPNFAEDFIFDQGVKFIGKTLKNLVTGK